MITEKSECLDRGKGMLILKCVWRDSGEGLDVIANMREGIVILQDGRKVKVEMDLNACD